jgi:preprotein translocase subunit SecE
LQTQAKRLLRTGTKPAQTARIIVPKTQSARKQNFLSRFISETVGELRKVSWPTRDEALRLTAIVMMVLIASSIFLGAIDALLTDFFRLILV